MPTGYTHAVQNGTVTEFSDFAMQCARAFGALVIMRDEPNDVPIPEKFEAHISYHDTELAKSQARLAELQQMSPARRAEACQQAFVETHRSWTECLAQKREHADRYKAMLLKVEAWTPPSEDHAGLKDFMEQQLRKSLDFDCCESEKWDAEPKPTSPDEWHASKVKEAAWSINYHTEKRAEEIERTNSRNKWLTDLRASLSAPR